MVLKTVSSVRTNPFNPANPRSHPVAPGKGAQKKDPYLFFSPFSAWSGV
jgi:hypothetical protein